MSTDSAAVATTPEPPAPEKPRFPTLAETDALLHAFVERCKRSDGTMPELVYAEISREELRAMFAASRYMDELGMLREARKGR